MTWQQVVLLTLILFVAVWGDPQSRASPMTTKLVYFVLLLIPAALIVSM